MYLLIYLFIFVFMLALTWYVYGGQRIMYVQELLLSSCGFRGFNSGLQAWSQVPTPAEPSCWLYCSTFSTLHPVLFVSSLQWCGWTQACVHSSQTSALPLRGIPAWPFSLNTWYSHVLLFLSFSLPHPNILSTKYLSWPFQLEESQHPLLALSFNITQTVTVDLFIIHFPHKNINSMSRRCCSMLLLHLIKTWYRAGQIFSIYLLNNEWTSWF